MWGVLIVFAVAATVDWVAVAKRSRALEVVAKPAALALLVAAALAMDPADEAARAALVAALLLSLIGDVALLPARDGSAPHQRLFAAGLASFLLGHLAYVAAFGLAGVEAAWLAVGALVAGAIALGVGRPVVRAVAASPEPALVRPVGAYVTVICAMTASAVGTGEVLAIAGALLFATSDALIARGRFVAPVPGGRLAVIVTYHLAQALLVLSFA